MKFDDYIMISDLDGTLLNEDNIITEKNINAINYFRENGGLFTVASGRTYFDIEEVTNAVEKDLPVICGNGSIIYDLKSKKEVNALTLKNYSSLIEYVKMNYPEVSIEFEKNGITYIYRKNEATKVHQKVAKLKCSYIDDLKDAPSEPVKINFWAQPNILDILGKDVINTGICNSFESVRGYTYCYETTNKNASKGFGANFLKKYSNRNKLISVGDNENDVSMLKVADIAICPANSSEIAKSYASVITKSNYNESVFSEIIFDILD